jgi:hypothetical protein
MPGPLLNFGQTGKGQVRATAQIGRMWTEHYPPMKAGDASAQGFLATVAKLYREGTILDIDHRSRRTLLGAGGGTPLVNGASQVGTSLVTDGWPNNTLVLKAGDLIKLGGLNPVQGSHGRRHDERLRPGDGSAFRRACTPARAWCWRG